MTTKVEMRTSTRISKRPSSSTSQLPIATVPTTVTGSASVSDVTKSTKKKWILKQSPRTLFFGSWQPGVLMSDFKRHLTERLLAPAKPSKVRVNRLAVISSISQMVDDAKRKTKPISKPSKTPSAKGKQVAAKYLTTPRNKKCPPNPSSFRSVQNPKLTSIQAPKNRMVAKALVFHSPKKAISIKTSSELHTPLINICEGLKRLEISNQRKRVFRYSSKSSKDNSHDPNKSLPVDHSKRQLGTCKDEQNQGIA